NSNYLENLVKSRPKDLDTELFVFSRADEITPQMIQYFKEMNVKRVNMGLDSGDNEMLKTGITKGTTSVDTNWNAVRQLHDAKIQMYVSFVLGGIGESEKSLENTYNFARDLVKYDHVVVVDPSPLLPLPGAPSWKFVKDKFQGQDLIDTEKAAKIWTERMCKVDWKTLKEYNSKIKNLAIENNRILGGYGIKNV
ncbi:MAG: radical SAM protein, partial [Nanoarchaeota archaeon]|nr:radical SAM protein [Nanoarchaeota archaeon]